MPGGKRRIRDGTDAAIPISLRPWQIGCIVSRPNRPFLVSDSPLGFAHRGGAALFPENTLPAFQHALELGCRYLETDVHLSRDGVIVVAHDERVDRTTDGSGRVSEMTLAELRRFDAGYRFSPNGRNYPWRAKGLEWENTTSPPPTGNFEHTPIVTEEAYEYSHLPEANVVRASTH